MLNALIYRQNRQIAGVRQPSAAVKLLQTAQNLRAAIAGGKDAIYPI
jgi:hypothetical protein